MADKEFEGNDGTGAVADYCGGLIGGVFFDQSCGVVSVCLQPVLVVLGIGQRTSGEAAA